MRATWHSFRRKVARRPRAFLAIGLVAATAAVIGTVMLFSRPSTTSTANLPTATSAERWTLIQLATPNHLRGRVMAVWQMGGLLQSVGSLPMGLLISAYGIQIGMGSFMIAATAAFLLFTALWGSVRRM